MVTERSGKSSRSPYRLRRDGWRRHATRHGPVGLRGRHSGRRDGRRPRSGGGLRHAVRRRGGRRRRGPARPRARRRVRVRAAVRPPPRRDLGRGAGGGRRVCRCSWRSRWRRTWPPPRRSPATGSTGCSPGSATTGAAPSPWRSARELLADRTVRLRLRDVVGQGAAGVVVGAAGPVGRPGRRAGDPRPRPRQGARRRGDEVTARAHGTVPGGDVDAVTTALLSFANGAVGSLSAASVLGAKHRAGTGDRRGRARGRRRRGLAGGARRRRRARALGVRPVDGVRRRGPGVRRRGGGPAGRPA